MSHYRRCRLIAPLFAAVLLGCPSEPPADEGVYENVMAFDSARARLVGPNDTLWLALQLAVSAEQKSMGLMERRRLADSAGMLFVYDTTQPPDAGFWMYRTRIPLDIAFLDSAGVIRAVRSMTPCPTSISQGCPTYAPGVPYRFALEVNAGYFARHGITVGDSLLLRDVASLAPAAGTRPGSR